VNGVEPISIVISTGIAIAAAVGTSYAWSFSLGRRYSKFESRLDGLDRDVGELQKDGKEFQKETGDRWESIARTMGRIEGQLGAEGSSPGFDPNVPRRRK
jgi:hypothetical protein